MHANEPPPPSPSAAEAPLRQHDPILYERTHRHANQTSAISDQEILTYDEAAQLLKISARTLERWTREGTPDVFDAFLEHLATERKLSASSVNHHRTIVNGIFNFAVKRGRFDRNPVAAVRQRPEPPGRDRIVSPAEFRLLWDKAEGDREMRAFLALAGTTTMRKGEVLSVRADRIQLEDAPYATLVRTKTGYQRHVPIPQAIVKTL